MTRFIPWRETVACSSAWLLVLLAVHSGYTQPAREVLLQKKITLHSDHLSAETILQRIEALAQIHFLYSSSLIELDKPLAISFRERPLKEVLDVIGKQLNLELKMQGRYVILKKLVTPHTLPVTSPPVASRVSRPAVMHDAPSLPPRLPEPGFYHDSLITYRKLKRTLLQGKSDFGLDTAFLRRYLKQPVHTLLKPAIQSRWLVSVGVFANDYAAGTEVRAGLHGLYAVINTGYLRGGAFRNGIGAGTSFRIKPELYLNPVYTYARLKREEDYNMFSTLKVTSQHHQVKLLLTYSPTRHITLQLGPTFNVLKSHYAFKASGEFRKILAIRSTLRPQGPDAGSSESGGIATPGYGYTQGSDRVMYNMAFTQAVRLDTPYHADYEGLRSWAGFEVNISYSINFYRRP